MPTQTELLNKLSDTIDTAINRFNKGMPSLQRAMLDDIILLVKDLDITSTGQIKNSITNLKTIGKIKGKLEVIILNDDYIKEVKRFTEAFNTVSKLQNQYFGLIEDDFTPAAILKEIQKQSIDSTIVSLTESGISSNVIEVIQDLLRVSITTGASYTQLTEQLRGAMLSNKSGGGLLERYSKQITVDSLMQFSRQYSDTVSNDLGLNFFMYVGSNITTTRELCLALTAKKYIHISEIPDIVKGRIDGKQVPISPKTKTWAGGVPGTNTANFKVYCGGYNCQHQLAPVSSAVVPAAIRAKFGG